ncbi:MAG: carotenoid oxygenase family protein [Deltaproteobacteria bacterium]|nr:carotenoid oxygenase family protein [Deltaproteobacteria bacterium]
MPRDPMRDANNTPSWIDNVDNPYLHGVYAPSVHETTAFDLDVTEGEIPSDLCGAYVRNGPNAVFEPSALYHWFDGDAMVHGVYFRDGKVGYRSRFIRTDALAEEMAAERSLWPGIMGPFDFDTSRGFLKDTANTDIIHHNGKLLATWYMCGDVYQLDPLTLDGRGKNDFGGKLTTSVSAHPKVDARTGELVYFTLSDDAPYMRYGVVSKDGDLVHETPIDLPGPRAAHDLTITENYTLLHDFPLFHDVELQRKIGHRVAKFHPELPSRFGVLPRHAGNDQVRWFEFEPAYVLHMVNAWEEGDWIIMDGCTQPDPTIKRRKEDGELASMLGYLRINAHLHRWCMNLATGETKEMDLDDLNVEFCLPDTDLYGSKTRYSYHQQLPVDGYTVEFHALVKYDHEDGTRTRYEYGPGNLASESPFARRAGSESEDDGYVVTIVTNPEWRHHSECWVFRAQEIERGPIAKVKLPARIPPGFHAKWVRGEELWDAS